MTATTSELEQAAASALGQTCLSCGAHGQQLRYFETAQATVVIESACAVCGKPRRQVLPWPGEGLQCCPACRDWLMHDGHRIGPESFDWPSQCPRCHLRFVDHRYPYRLRMLVDGHPPIDQAFADLASLDAAIQDLEQRKVPYLSRGPSWQGGSIKLSQAAAAVWHRVIRTAVARKQPRREWRIQGSRREAVA